MFCTLQEKKAKKKYYKAKEPKNAIVQPKNAIAVTSPSKPTKC